MTTLNHPLHSLRKGRWFKLICGASFQHLPAIRSLALAYSLAGADCIDVAADPAALEAARSGIEAALRWGAASGPPRDREASPEDDPPASLPTHRPWLMVSLSDGDDPHFRKARFDPRRCPSDCPRPCERICPTRAIGPLASGPDAPESPLAPGVATGNSSAEVLRDRPTFDPARRSASRRTDPGTATLGIPNFGLAERLCYGCGRCVPACPLGLIDTRTTVASPESLVPTVLASGTDALEIHTQIGRESAFDRLWAAARPYFDRLKLVAVSCPDGPGSLAYLRRLAARAGPDLAAADCALLWQTDGRPMSGDLGRGTTRAAIAFGRKVLAAGLPGFVQLAGGTNAYTVPKLRSLGLLAGEAEPGQAEPVNIQPGNIQPGNIQPGHVKPGDSPVAGLRDRDGSPARRGLAGVAYGSAARVQLQPVLDALADLERDRGVAVPLEAEPALLARAVALAAELVRPLKEAETPPVSPRDDGSAPAPRPPAIAAAPAVGRSP